MKSAPMIAVSTLATIKVHFAGGNTSKWTVSVLEPWTATGVPLIACTMVSAGDVGCPVFDLPEADSPPRPCRRGSPFQSAHRVGGCNG
ncbi:hypothetical protein M514_20941 [Trichuris suis]|uniref:Uncharacterized protein n=1 Tax=Trichuris suis TaxID=68888 RepID=A0A085NBF1_9BILA|nr:hypothetical protein M514_20941 [Trichuris suis]